jgi:hypothetical protein
VKNNSKFEFKPDYTFPFEEVQELLKETMESTRLAERQRIIEILMRNLVSSDNFGNRTFKLNFKDWKEIEGGRDHA